LTEHAVLFVAVCLTACEGVEDEHRSVGAHMWLTGCENFIGE